MATGTMAVRPSPKRRRITTAATSASSLPALVRTWVASSSSLAATAGKSAAKSGGGIELAARARSASELTPQALQKAAASGEPLRRVVRGSRGARIGGPQNSVDGGAANPVSGAFVADGESPASSANRHSLRVAAIGNGTRAGDDNRRPGRRRRRLRARFACRRPRRWAWAEFPPERGGRIPPIPDERRRNRLRRCATTCAGVMPAAAHAWRTDCCSDSRACASPTRTILLGPAVAVASSMRFIAHRAGGLRAAAVDAEIVGHVLFLTQSRLPVTSRALTACRRGLQSLTRGKGG